jgi:chromosome segregation protein
MLLYGPHHGRGICPAGIRHASHQTQTRRLQSFVDPTAVAVPGQLVGVVGPNGCGKSNIMDAVRWVLGESKASELRGESMMDVIFNGSTNRKPVSRASVELIFENLLGRALGQWSQYAELSVKRTLTRQGQSDYFINNLKVRRKDITDLFLGTGLGPRAYAIIGQGMISRIIEAKPDDLRVFLEEAAGVTRYKERRKETQRPARRHAREPDCASRTSASNWAARWSAGSAGRSGAPLPGAERTTGSAPAGAVAVEKARSRGERQRVALEVERAVTELEAQKRRAARNRGARRGNPRSALRRRRCAAQRTERHVCGQCRSRAAGSRNPSSPRIAQPAGSPPGRSWKTN